MFVWRNGLYVPGADLWLDPPRVRERAFVSHAHGDHVRAHGEILATPETARFLRLRLGESAVIREIGFGEPFDVAPGFRATLHPAGHVLGAAQIELEHRGQRLVYTGDFRLLPGATTAPCRIVPCDLLVMETTFGLPHYRFPPREEVIPRLVEDLRGVLAEERTPVLLAYALGRSQELLKLLEPHGFDIHLVPPIDAVVGVYEELGVRFGPHRRARPGHVAGGVLFAPPHLRRSRLRRYVQDPVRFAMTGWAMDGQPPYAVEHCYPFSDHADFDELLRYVEEARPRVVYTLHGFDEFRSSLAERGVSAWPAKSRVWMR